MSSEAGSPDQLPELTSLTAVLADMVLDAQIMGRPVTEEQIRALANAARLLREHDVAWPPILKRVMHRLAQEAGEIAYEAPPGRPAGSTADLLGFPTVTDL